MQHARRSKRGLIFSLLSLVALVAALTLGVGLHQHASQAHAQSPSLHLLGPKQHYLALGDSLAYGFQPNCSTVCTHGYVNDLFNTLQNEGTKDVTNYGCPGETSTSFIGGGCFGAPPLPYTQLGAAVTFLQAHPGTVSPVTLDIGSNDVLPDLSACVVDQAKFTADLGTLDSNLNKILHQLQTALTVHGRVTGSIVMMNYYNPFPNCLTNAQFTQDLTEFNTLLATDARGVGGFIVDVLGAFGGITTPNICTSTWLCTPPHAPGCVSPCPDIHPTDLGYTVIANTFAAALPPN